MAPFKTQLRCVFSTTLKSKSCCRLTGRTVRQIHPWNPKIPIRFNLYLLTLEWTHWDRVDTHPHMNRLYTYYTHWAHTHLNGSIPIVNSSGCDRSCKLQVHRGIYVQREQKTRLLHCYAFFFFISFMGCDLCHSLGNSIVISSFFLLAFLIFPHTCWLSILTQRSLCLTCSLRVSLTEHVTSIKTKLKSLHRQQHTELFNTNKVFHQCSQTTTCVVIFLTML